MVSDSITGPNPTMATVPIESSGASHYAVAPIAERSVEKLQAQFPDTFFEVRRFRDEVTVYVPREQIVTVATFLRDDEELRYNYLSDLTGNDWPDRDPRFEVIYHLYSIKTFGRLRLKVRVSEDDCTCPTVTGVWTTANWHEREVFDMFGIIFEGHPDLRRILLPDEWVGHPLRQDYEIGWEEPEFTVRKVHRNYAKG
ncbi:MAG: NADH-quinone oxidoreductase subunit C [Abitibacteriaceae bacterium]|nr:NADH-quinone oxidoreductase subunit C [Abditibacteriaceae bacterium]